MKVPEFTVGVGVLKVYIHHIGSLETIPGLEGPLPDST
jgi:hypothetical protein